MANQRDEFDVYHESRPDCLNVALYLSFFVQNFISNFNIQSCPKSDPGKQIQFVCTHLKEYF